MSDITISDLTRTVRTKIHACGCGCWVWTGSVNAHGYAKAKLRGSTFLVHRYTYEKVFGPLDEDATIDHLCDRHRNCVNPAHMEPVSRSENSTRASSRRWHEGEPDRSACTEPEEG